MPRSIIRRSLVVVVAALSHAAASTHSVATRLHSWRASAASAGCHIVSAKPGDDIHLSRYCAGGTAFPSLGSRTQANNAAQRRELLVNGVEAHGATRVRLGDVLTLQTPTATPMTPGAMRRVEKFYSELAEMKPERGGRLEALFEDDELAVVFKPPGVHSTAWAGTRKKWGDLTLSDALPLLLTAPQQPSSSDGEEGVTSAPLPSPLAAHRLDARVGGVIAVAKTHRALAGLSRLFKDRGATKVYRAVVVGDVQLELFAGSAACRASGGEWSYSLLEASPSFDRIGSSSSAASRALRVEQVNAEGRRCVTEVRVVQATPCSVHGTLTTLELRPLTGRRHQLRLLCSRGLGAPIVGDDLYHDDANAARAALSPPDAELSLLPPVRRRAGLFLQATELSFAHPVTGESVCVRAPEMARFERLRARAASGAGFSDEEWEAWRADDASPGC